MSPSTFGKAVARETVAAKKAAKKTAGNSEKAVNGKKPLSEAQKKTLEANKFQPGQSGNPSGRPKRKIITDTLTAALEMIDGKTKKTVAALIADALIEAAKKGDLAAIKEIADRVEGKAVQTTQLTGLNGGPVAIDHLSPEEKRQRIAELQAKASGTSTD